jgi:hypothetical protein
MVVFFASWDASYYTGASDILVSSPNRPEFRHALRQVVLPTVLVPGTLYVQ